MPTTRQLSSQFDSGLRPTSSDNIYDLKSIIDFYLYNEPAGHATVFDRTYYGAGSKKLKITVEHQNKNSPVLTPTEDLQSVLWVARLFANNIVTNYRDVLLKRSSFQFFPLASTQGNIGTDDVDLTSVVQASQISVFEAELESQFDSVRLGCFSTQVGSVTPNITNWTGLKTFGTADQVFANIAFLI